MRSWINKNFSIDDLETTVSRRDILENKKFLKNIYIDWYEMVRSELDTTNGIILEIGSGAGFLQDVVPNVVTSEIMKVPQIAIILDALHLPFDNSLGGVVMVDVFHHLCDASVFLQEASKALRKDGLLIMIEPWVTPLSRLIYSHLHHEPFEPETVEWSFHSSGPLSGANGALPWIVFERDRHIFEVDFPSLIIKKIQPFMPIRYLMSGGFTTLFGAPSFLYKPVKRFESLFKPVMNRLGMFALIVVQKKDATRIANDEIPSR